MNTIGIDGRALKYRFKSGVEEYTEKILENMVGLDSSIKYKIFASGSRDDLEPRPWFFRSNVEVFNFKIPNKLLSVSSLAADYPKIDKILNVDRFFSPHVFALPLSRSCKKITTFHDLSFERFPTFFSVKQKMWHKFQMNARTQARLSDKIITVSESTKRDLVNIYNIDPVKIEVIYSGISEDLKRAGDEDLLRFKNENNVPDKFFVFIGTLEPRKNVINIIKAFNNIADRDSSIKLVIIGRKGWLYKNIFREIDNSKHKERIIYLGYVSEDNKRKWLALSQALIYPSYFEGFGFPVLEAMRLGVPVITSRNSSLVEVAGKSALLINPYNIDEIAMAMDLVVNNKKIKEELVMSGIDRSRMFSWQKAAEKTLSLILRI